MTLHDELEALLTEWGAESEPNQYAYWKQLRAILAKFPPLIEAEIRAKIVTPDEDAAREEFRAARELAHETRKAESEAEQLLPENREEYREIYQAMSSASIRYRRAKNALAFATIAATIAERTQR